MATASNLNIINNNTAAITSNLSPEIHVKGKDVNPLLLLMMLQANSEDGKDLLEKLSNAKSQSKDELDLSWNIFLLLAEVEEKNRKANESSKTAILASVNEAQTEYKAAVDTWKADQLKANEVFSNSVEAASKTANWTGIVGIAGLGALVGGALGALVSGAIGALVGAGIIAAITLSVAACIGIGVLVGLVIAAIVIACVKDINSTTKPAGPDPSKQGDIQDANTTVTQDQNTAQQKEQVANTTMDSEFSPAQQVDSTIFTMFNAFVNWYGQLGQIFNGG